MPEQKLAQITELWQRIVSKGCGLVALFTKDSDADMSRLDHVDIVSTVTDGHRGQARELLRAHVLADVGHCLGLLRG